MRIKEDFEVINADGQHIVAVKNGKNTLLTEKIVLNDTALFLWNMLKEKDTAKPEMLDRLLNAFDISTVLALGEIDVFLRTMKEYDIIEE